MKTMRTIIGVMHFLMYKVFYLQSLKSKGLSVCSFWSKMIIEKDGSIQLNGKLALGDHCELRAIGKIQIGDKVYINKNSRIVSHNNIEIGNNVLIAQFVSILDHDHKYEFKNGEIQFNGYNTEPIRIGNNVLIGDKVTILKGTVIGDNVIIGAHSLVKGIIPSNSKLISPLAGIHVSDSNSGLI